LKILESLSVIIPVMILLTFVLIPFLDDPERISILVTVHLGIWSPLVFFIINKKSHNVQKINLYSSLLKSLSRMKQIMEEHKDGKPFVYPENVSELIKQIPPAHYVIEKYSHLVRTAQRFDDLRFTNIGFFPIKIIENMDRLHDSIDSRKEFTDKLQSKGEMYEVVKVYQLVTELIEQITELQEKL